VACRPLTLAAAVLASIAAPAGAIEKASEQVSPFYGSFAHSIAVEVPGFRGLEPRIALSYSSEGRNGFVGVGWSVSGFSTIQRANQGLGTPMFGAGDVYLLDGQELVACAGGSVSPGCTSGGTHSTKIESYQKIKFDATANTWTVWSKDGTRTSYSSIVTVPAGPYTPGGTLRWGVSSRTDTDNNTVSYTWNCPGTDKECYPQAASYNGYAVSFFTETRPDVISWAAASVLGQTRYRLRSIIVWAPSQSAHIRGYKLGYQTSALSGRSLLASVQQFGKDLVHDGAGLITGGTTLPAHTFAYQDDTIGKTFADWGSAPTRDTYSEPVTWANLVNTVPAGSGSSLYKTAGGENWNAGADSSRAIASGNGYVQWISSEPSTAGKAIGLSNGNTDATLADIDFALQEAAGNLLYAVENGTPYGPWPRTNGDALRVEVAGNVVYYKRNGVVLRQSTRTPSFPLRVDASIYAPSGAIQDAVMSGALTYVNSWCQAIAMSGDFNGDGRTDQLCYATTGTPTAKVSLATASGFATPTTWLSGQAFTQPVFADFNNDGKADVALYDNWTGEFRVALSTGSAFAAPTVWGSAAATAPGGGAAACRVDPASVGSGDFNGDGLKDVYCKSVNPANPYQFIGLSNGTSAFTFSVFGALGCDTYDARTGAIDFDGDGKDDWFCVGYQNNLFAVFTSDGTQFLYPAFGSLDGSFCSSGGYILADLNGDGRTDAACNNGKVALSTGRAFAVQGAYGGWCFAEHSEFFGADVDGDGASEIVCNNPGSTATDIQVRKWNGQALAAAETWRADWCSGKVSSGDWNGDGKSDLHCTTTARPAVAGTGGRLVDIVNGVNNGLGGSVQLVYTPSSAFVHTNNPSVKQTITSLTIADGRGWSATTTFEYAGGLMDWKERRFLGFRYAKKTLPCLAGESSCPYEETWFKQDLASAGSPETLQRHAGSGNILAQQTFAYATNGTTIPRTSLLTGETSYSYGMLGCPSPSCAQEKRVSLAHSYDAYGNRTQTTFTGDVSAGGDEKSVSWDYRPNASAFIVGRLAREQHFDQAGALKAATRLRYDLASTWDQPPTKGHVTETEKWLDTENRWTVAPTRYDSWGNAISIKDATNRGNTITYDPTYHLYPETVTNAAGESETTLWDAVCGLPRQHTDANLQLTYLQSDALCRRTRADLPLGGFEATYYRDFGDPNWQRVVVETPPAVPGGTNQYAAQHFDGLGRGFYTLAKGPTPSQSILTQTTFNARGAVASQTAPYYVGAATYTTSYGYDGLDRVVSIGHPDGHSVGKSYGLWSETTTDENGRPTTLRFDGYGRVRVKEETLNGQTLQTVFTYDSLGRQIGLTDPVNLTWSWVFDSLGRNTRKNDPDTGIWNWVYDDEGRVTQQTDAKHQRVETSYDVAGRPSGRRTYNSDGGLTSTVTLAYGEARPDQFNVGRLTSVTAPGNNLLRKGYDARGRAFWNWRQIDQFEYLARTAFDAAGRVLSVQYPDGTVGPHGYDGAGRLRSISGIVSEVLYDASGHPTSRTNANGTTTQASYSPARGFLQTISTTGPLPVQQLDYTNDPTGRLEGVTSAHPRESWSYDYDDLYRLVASTGTDGDTIESQTWQYDAIGRMAYNSRIGTYTYGSAHAPLTAGPNSYSYDLNGNMVSGGGRTLTWDVNNLVTQANGTQFVYDGMGERIKKSTGSSVSRYPFGDDYEITNGTVTRYISAPGLGVIAKVVQGQTYWLHTDRLGSIQAITDQVGQVVQRRTYRAFGEKIADTTGHVESRGWIDQRNDGETGLTYLHARYYDPALGVFISPDPIGAQLNAYAYGPPDPVNGTDRSGLDLKPCPPPNETQVCGKVEEETTVTANTGNQNSYYYYLIYLLFGNNRMSSQGTTEANSHWSYQVGQAAIDAYRRQQVLNEYLKSQQKPDTEETKDNTTDNTTGNTGNTGPEDNGGRRPGQRPVQQMIQGAKDAVSRILSPDFGQLALGWSWGIPKVPHVVGGGGIEVTVDRNGRWYFSVGPTVGLGRPGFAYNVTAGYARLAPGAALSSFLTGPTYGGGGSPSPLAAGPVIYGGYNSSGSAVQVGVGSTGVGLSPTYTWGVGK
jgi:RHS repeat-associated protein